MAIIVFFPLQDTSPPRSPVRTLTATEMATVTPMRLKKLAPLRPPTFFLFFLPAETKQMQSRNKETIHRHSQSSRCSHRKLRPHRGEVHGKRADPRLTKRLIFRDSVNKNNYDTLITALILAGLVFWLMAAAAPHRWSPETSGSQI